MTPDSRSPSINITIAQVSGNAIGNFHGNDNHEGRPFPLSAFNGKMKIQLPDDA